MLSPSATVPGSTRAGRPADRVCDPASCNHSTAGKVGCDPASWAGLQTPKPTVRKATRDLASGIWWGPSAAFHVDEPQRHGHSRVHGYGASAPAESFLEAPRRSLRLQDVQASCSTPLLPHPPSPISSPPPPHAPPIPQCTMPVEPLDDREDIYTLLQAVIGEEHDDFFDSQECLDIHGRESSCEELSKDSFDEGAYAFEEGRCLEEMLWSEELQYNVHTYDARVKKKKKKTRHMVSIARGHGASTSGAA
ncbi:hypothetical protein KC19_9G093500 [Ceratodon purpureus]|uniref:Uncharacterized protein n=1 Tax=Ceratodon purpureus TaxID=3225 RepID=A0A8T0GTV7_CERPU|nr:hypothetical protein KC19_9G093500 [Ceratodon purpureus]